MSVKFVILGKNDVAISIKELIIGLIMLLGSNYILHTLILHNNSDVLWAAHAAALSGLTYAYVLTKLKKK